MAAGAPRFVAAEPKTAMSAPVLAPAPRAPVVARGGALPLTGGGRLPLVFIVAGLVAFGLAAAWLARVAGRGSGFPPFLHPEVVAVAHLWLPGFLLSICLGATYQLMPVVLGEAVRLREGWLWTHAGLHLAGVVALVWGLASGRYLAAGLGGLAVVAGVAILGVATLRTFRVSRRRDAAAWSFVCAAGWLLATVVAGVGMALNRRHGFLPLSMVDLLRAHAHLGLVGYFASLLQGVTFQLVPMFTMGEARRPRLAMAGLLATQAGLPILAAGLAWGASGPTVAGAGVVAVGLVGTGWALAATLATRRRRRLDVGVRAFVVGMALLGLGGAGGLALALGAAGGERLLPGAVSYGLVVIVGGLSFTVLGMLAKILPFLVWMKAYGPRVGRESVPVATALSSRRLEEFWFVAHLLGLVSLLAGVLTETQIPAMAGGVLLLAGAALWLGNAARVLSHLLRAVGPKTAAMVAAKPARAS